MGEYTPPTQDEIRRVAEYWRRVGDLTCAHEELTFERDTAGPVCAKCRRPIRLLSDIQIEEMKR